MNLKRDNSPRLDGFGAISFQLYWDIIGNDVTRVVPEFFKDDWILPHYNSKTIMLIHKSNEGNTINQYKPISLSNFKHNFITKILANGLAYMLLHITSSKQKWFTNGRKIGDYICLTTEGINLLNKKAIGGN